MSGGIQCPWGSYKIFKLIQKHAWLTPGFIQTSMNAEIQFSSQTNIIYTIFILYFTTFLYKSTFSVTNVYTISCNAQLTGQRDCDTAINKRILLNLTISNTATQLRGTCQLSLLGFLTPNC